MADRPIEIKLAIVIPAYKSTFLKEAIDSVLKQTNQLFNLYIGIDGPLNDTIRVLEPYKDKQNLTIHVFDKNLGKKDLVAQWERCIALSRDEEYIWLFPDDDAMSHDCVEGFYQFINKTNERPYLLRFNNYRIDDHGNPITELNPLPETETGDEYMLARILEGRVSSVAEHIFAREAYGKYGIVKFPAAWGSDTITWYVYGNNNRIRTVPTGMIMTRQGEQNISSASNYFLKEKLNASYMSINYLINDGFFERNSFIFKEIGGFYTHMKNRIFDLYSFYGYKFTFSEIFVFAKKNSEILKDGYLKNLLRLFYYNSTSFKKITKFLK